MAGGQERKANPKELVELLSRKVVGQPAAIKFIVPYIQIAQAGLAPRGRPIGVLLCWADGNRQDPHRGSAGGSFARIVIAISCAWIAANFKWSTISPS